MSDALPERLDALFSEYLDRLNGGETIDPLQVLYEEPELGPELLEKLECFVDLTREAPVDQAGRTLGDYTLRRELGRGGMGVVYEAWENSMDRRVALKVLPVGVAADDTAFQRFLREAKTAGKLSHPSVVPVYFTGIKEQTPFYAMEYVEGETLAQVLCKLKEAEPEADTAFGRKDQVGYFANLASAFADVADGLQHAHQKGVVHRDIKPSNLILDREGPLRILDFGLARLEGQEALTLTGDFVGTPAYMSPEQAARRKIAVDHRTDVYSLGATIYELLTHQQPFRGSDHHDTLSRIVEEDARPPRQLNPRVPRDFETIVLKCLRKDAADRYGTAEALGQDLRRFVRGDPIEARPEGRLERIGRRLWRAKTRIAALASAVALLLVLALLFFQYRSAAHEVRLVHYEERIRRAAMKLLLTEVMLRTSLEVQFMDTTHLRYSEKLALLIPGAKENPVEALIDALEKCSRDLPGRPEALYYRGRALLLLDREEEARVAFEEALHRGFFPAAVYLRPGDAEMEPDGAAAGAARSSAWLAAHRAVKNENWLDAEEAFTRLIELARTEEPLYFGADVDARMGRALCRLESGDGGGAVVALASARDEWPTLMEPALLLGRAWYLYGDADEAERTFRDLLERGLHPPDEVRFWVALTYQSVKGAERGLEWAAQIDDAAVRERMKAGFLYRLRLMDEAIAAARKAIEVNPTDFYAYAFLGKSLYYRGLGRGGRKDPALTEEIVRAARKAIELNDRACIGYEILGMGLRWQGKREEALEAMYDAVERGPRNAWARANLGFTLMVLDRLDEAERETLEALRLDPERGVTWDSLAYLRLRMGDDDAAVEAFRNARRLDPALPAPHKQLGKILQKRGDWSGARECYEAYLDLRPDAPGMYQRLGQVLLELGEFAEAEAALRRAIDLGSKKATADLATLLEKKRKTEEACRVRKEAGG